MSSKAAKSHVQEKTPEFANQLQELQYWKSKFEAKDNELLDLEESFTDFQQSSKELEVEMERELTSNEKKLKDMTSTYHRLKSEHDEMVEKSRRVAEDSGRMIHSLQDETEALKKSNKDLRREKQRLEQENDELERRVRESEASLQDLTEKMNKTLEENSFLQTELEDTKNRSQEMIQRMKDEIRDMKLELSIKNNPVGDESNQSPSKSLATNTELALINHVPTQPATKNGMMSPRFLSKVPEGSIELVDDILLLVKDMERRLMSQKTESSLERTNSFPLLTGIELGSSGSLPLLNVEEDEY